MENTFMLDFSNTVGGFMTGVTESVDLFTATFIILLAVGGLILLMGRKDRAGNR
ncbi:hypothetical protein GQ472_01985 [archaeon]|nr:hypothetical protein [archaeon]